MREYIEGELDELEGAKLMGYEVQVVNGWNHRLIYENEEGDRVEVMVYEDMDNNLGDPIATPVSDDEESDEDEVENEQ